MNQFASVLTSATEAIATGLNMQVRGTPIVVYNPLNIAREDVVQASVFFDKGVPKSVRVFSPEGKEVPAQLIGVKHGAAQILFLAKVLSVSYAVYDVQASDVQGNGA